MTHNDAALVLFSGGQDSTTCLAWALARFARVETVGFAYGQRHAVELDCRGAAARRAGGAVATGAAGSAPDHLVDLGASLSGIGATALTSEAEIRMTAEGLPSTFVPGRNLVFLAYAAAIAYRRGLRRIVAGMCETDYSGYPDCRDDTLKAMQLALNLGMERRFVVETPLMWVDKAGHLGARRGSSAGAALVALIVERTHSCYLRRPRAPARMGLWLRHLPGLRAARGRLAAMAGGARLTLRFLHAADLHLDSPLRGLDNDEGAPAELIRNATRRALGRLVDLALEEDVAFLLIAGDIYDGDWPDYRTGMFFAQQMARLTRAGKPVIAIRGNHDAQNRMTRSLRLPEGVTLLDHERPRDGGTARVSASPCTARVSPPRRSPRTSCAPIRRPVAGPAQHRHAAYLSRAGRRPAPALRRPAPAPTWWRSATTTGRSATSTRARWCAETPGSSFPATCRAGTSTSRARKARRW